MTYIVAWSSGHKPIPRPVFLHIYDDGWDATYQREKATVFKSRRAAMSAWRERHVRPDRYKYAFDQGLIRIEKAGEPELCF